MKRLMFVLGAVAFAAFALAGCGGDDDAADEGDTLSLQAYFDEVDALVDAYIADNNDAFTVLSESDDLDELKTAFALLPETLADFLTSLDGLGTPAEAAEAEEDVVTTGEAFLAELEEVNEEAQATESVDAFAETAGTDDLQELSDAFNATCAPLQQVASDNGVEIELDCPE